MVHLQHAVSKIQGDEFMKLKYEFPHFQEYVIQNLQNLIKISKGKDGLVFQLANMLNDKIVDI